MPDSVPTDRIRLRPGSWLPALVLFAVALVLSVRLAPPILADDAAISLRYAERIVEGKGFTWNDDERVQGASNPLFTLALAALIREGLPPERAGELLSILAFALSVGLATAVGARMSTPAGGFAAGLLLLADRFVSRQALSGMETGLTLSLALGALLALLSERRLIAGILLGLVLVNKLDGALFLAAVLGALLFFPAADDQPFRERLRKLADLTIPAAVVAAPWFLFAWGWFGTAVPNSLSTKIAVGAEHPLGFGWVLRFFAEEDRWALLVPAGVALWFTLRRRGGCRTAAASLAGWFLLHAAALGTVSLGDRYPWYLAPLAAPAAVLAGVFFSQAIGQLRDPIGALLPAAGILLLVLGISAPLEATLADLSPDRPMTVSESFDFDRREAGRFLARNAEPGEVVSTGFGWVAFASGLSAFDTTLLNIRDGPGEGVYAVHHGIPWDRGDHPPLVPPGMVPLASFDRTARSRPGFSWFTLFGLPESAIARRGVRSLRLTDLGPPRPLDGKLGLGHVEVRSGDLFAHPPSGARFDISPCRGELRLSFRPGFLDDPATWRSDGVSFELRENGAPFWRELVRPTLPSKRVELLLPPLPPGSTRELAFVTDAGPAGNLDWDWAIWREIRVDCSGENAGVPTGRSPGGARLPGSP
jgi:hypothetical protein